MALIKTKVGELEVPEMITERARFWAGALVDLIRVDELYGVVQAILDEGYDKGYRDGVGAW